MIYLCTNCKHPRKKHSIIEQLNENEHWAEPFKKENFLWTVRLQNYLNTSQMKQELKGYLSFSEDKGFFFLVLQGN